MNIRRVLGLAAIGQLHAPLVTALCHGHDAAVASTGGLG